MDSRKPLTEREIFELMDLELKATPGEWQAHDLGASVHAPDGNPLCRMLPAMMSTVWDNSVFIAAARNALPRLLSMLTPPPDAAVRGAVDRLDNSEYTISLDGSQDDTKQMWEDIDTLIAHARAVQAAPALPGDDGEICARLLSACTGHPHALIPWPHRLLHDAVAHISDLTRRLAGAEAENGRFAEMLESSVSDWRKLYTEERAERVRIQGILLNDVQAEHQESDEHIKGLDAVIKTQDKTIRDLKSRVAEAEAERDALRERCEKLEWLVEVQEFYMYRLRNPGGWSTPGMERAKIGVAWQRRSAANDELRAMYLAATEVKP